MNTSIPGLVAEVSLHIDRWGVTHIRAANQHDLFLAQGYNAARERLWQMDLWRKKGLGLLAADFGPGYLEQDRASRLTLYRGDMAAEWAAYSFPSDAAGDAEDNSSPALQPQAIAEAFVAGVNAYIDEVLNTPERLPVEFHQMGNKPSPWHADDVVRIRNSVLMRNAESELLRALVIRDGSAQLDAFRRAVDPFGATTVPEGLDLSVLQEGALDDLKLARAPMTFSAERLACSLAEAPQWRALDAQGEVTRSETANKHGSKQGSKPKTPPQNVHAAAELAGTTEADPDGSNNWALNGSRTASGRPIMATDPHRAYTMPSLRYLVHLSAPGIDVIGAGEPTQPGVAIGHNAHFAFSLTMLMMDQEDTYLYTLSDDDPELYRYEGGWERMRRIEERIDVKGAASQTVALLFTRHGAVLFLDAATKTAIAVRTVLSEPGGSAYFHSLGVMAAKTFDAYREALGKWSVPAVNHLYAGVDGRIAHIAAGKWPKRPNRSNWDGLMPVPGNGQFEWDGFYTGDAYPVEIDPDSGVVASANEWVFAQSHDHTNHPFSLEFAEPSRARRIRETLAAQQEAGQRHDVQDSARLQNDVLSLPALRVTNLLRAVQSVVDSSTSTPGMSADLQAALIFLTSWDGMLHRSGPAPALFETWWSYCLKPALFDEALARHTDASVSASNKAALRKYLPPGDTATLLAVLEQPVLLFAPNAAEATARRDALLCRTLVQAMQRCRERFGPEPAAWCWGEHHHAYFAHPLSALGKNRDVGPLPMAGSGATVAAAAYRLNDGRANFGASVRLVMDVGDWDQSLGINAPGQSGRPDSPHYSDLAEMWVNGEYFPLCYSRSAVNDATEQTQYLAPAGQV